MATPAAGRGDLRVHRNATRAVRVRAFRDASARFDDDVIDTIRAAVARQWELTDALTTDERTGLTGLQYTAPLRGTCCGR